MRVRYFVRIWRPPGTGKGQGQLLSEAVHSLAFWNQQLKAVRGGSEHRTCSVCLDEVCQLEFLCILPCAPFFAHILCLPEERNTGASGATSGDVAPQAMTLTELQPSTHIE